MLGKLSMRAHALRSVSSARAVTLMIVRISVPSLD